MSTTSAPATTAHASEPGSDSYDVVVIGSGLGGLSAAALLAKAGKSVLVVEQADGPGGYARAFKRGPYVFDPAIHMFAEGHAGKLPEALFEHLGVGDQVTFLPIDWAYRLVYPGLSAVMPFGLEEFIEAHSRLFPDEADGIDTFFRLCYQVAREAHELPPRLGLDNMDAAAKRFPTLFRYLRSTVAEVLDECIQDPRAKSVCGGQWPYPGTPPSRLSFVTFGTILTVELDGGFYCQGSFQSIVDALMTSLERNGGELVVSNRATRIGVEDRHVTEVELADGQRVRANVVVSNGDARRTFEEMIDAEQVPASFLRRLRRMVPSLSAVVVFGVTKLDLAALGAVHEVFSFKHFDHDETHRDILEGRPGGTWATCPSLVDPSLAPPGEQIVILTSLAQYDIGKPWPDRIEGFTEELIAHFEQALPGLGDGMDVLEAATPLTLERYALNRQGAAYGWENTPSQSGGRRAPHQTPIDGLFLSGHWTQPGTASLRVLVSGMHTAQMVLLSTGSSGLDFEHPDFPPI